MSEGFPNITVEAPPAAEEVLSDEFIFDNFGLTPEIAASTVEWDGRSMTLRDLVTKRPEGCPIDFAANFRKAHEMDPEHGAENHINTLVSVFNIEIKKPEPFVQPPEQVDPKKN